MTTSTIRPDWRTVRRPDPTLRPYAIAAGDGRCGCGAAVEAGDPVVCAGAQVEQDPDGRRRVDLSGVEWVCDRCVAALAQEATA